MAFKRKGAPSAKSLNDPEGVAQASQRSAGNSGYDISQDCYSSGVSPVNSKGQVTNKTGTVQNWPYQRFTVDNELNPKSNQAKPDILSQTPQTYGDFTVDGKVGGLGRVTRQTLG